MKDASCACNHPIFPGFAPNTENALKDAWERILRCVNKLTGGAAATHKEHTHTGNVCNNSNKNTCSNVKSSLSSQDSCGVPGSFPSVSDMCVTSDAGKTCCDNSSTQCLETVILLAQVGAGRQLWN